MAWKELIVTVKVEADTPARLKDKVAMINAFSNLPADDQQRMTKIMSNPEALKLIADNEQMLESMLPK